MKRLGEFRSLSGIESMEETVDWGADSPGDGGDRRVGDGAAAGAHGETKVNQGVKRKRSNEKGDGAESPKEHGGEKPSEDTAPGAASETKPEVNDDVVQRAKKFWEKAPERVKEAAKKSKDMGEYKRNRRFYFIHLFSGPVDNLAKAIIEAAKRAGLQAECRSLDIKLDVEHNLREADKWKKLGDEVDHGDFDGSHGGFPCGSFSRVRWREAVGYPPPVRSLEHPYGLPGNSPRQQLEADGGTLMATWTVSLMERQAENQKERGVPEVATVENPPGSETMFECPAWALPEIKEILERIEAHSVEFNTCAFMSKDKLRFFKPARWAGRLEGLRKLNRVCRCPSWVRHKPAVEGASVEAGVYPPELCDEIASLIIAQWRRTLNLEFWRYQLVMKSMEVTELQAKWLVNEEKKMERRIQEKVEVRMPEEFKGTNPALRAEDVIEDSAPRSTTLKTAKEIKEMEDIIIQFR